MKGISSEDIKRWRVEIDQAEKFRDEQLGKYRYNNLTKSAENIDYFEHGLPSEIVQQVDTDVAYPTATINLIYPIVKNVIPTLYWKNPHINVTPKRGEDESSAPYAGALLNYFFDELDVKSVNRQVIFDAFVIGMGVCKIGYATQFGSDIPDEDLEKNRAKRKERGLLEKLGLRKPREEEPPKQNVELNEYIRSESPYVVWVNPFEFGIDPTATTIHDARYVYQKVTKLLSEVKSNSNYKNTKALKGSDIEEGLTKDIPDTQIENFKTVQLYEIHYKTDEGIKILTLAKDGNNWEALRHEDSIYEIDGFQFEPLYFNKHNHRLYPKSDIDIIKGLQDRTQKTFDSMLDQIDRFVPKLMVDETGLSAQGKNALENGEVGSVVYTNKNPQEVFREASFTQLKGDLAVFVDKLLEIIMLETGLTRAQLMGMTNAETATEAQIGQAGQNLRLSDKFDYVSDFASRQARKLWQVIRQFVDLEEVELITGEQGVDDVTGAPKFDWLKPIDAVMSEKLNKGEYSFRIDVASLEKPDLPILRSQVERIANLIAQPGTMLAFQQQGYKINLAEFAKRYLQLFPYVFPDIGKILQPIGPATQGLIPPQMGPPKAKGGPLNSQTTPEPPSMSNILSGQAGTKGQGFPSV